MQKSPLSARAPRHGRRFDGIMIDRTRYLDCIRHIRAHWKTLTCATRRDRGLVIGLPHKYISPSRVEFDDKMYYWDTYFIGLGLLSENRVALARGMADNLLFLFKRFGFIPQSNRFYHLGKSNPPFLTSLISEIFLRTGDRRWLRRALDVAALEYERVWLGPYRKTENGLSRYFEPTHVHEQAEDESGWDRTSRFLDRCLHINPVDLNCLLYKYETDLAALNGVLNRSEQVSFWKRKAVQRKRLANRHFWDERRGYYFDYDFVSKKRTAVWSLAGFFPLWTGMATPKQAKRLVENLKHFEYEGGLVTTRRVYLKNARRQWDFPNGWPNLQWVVVKGLLEYGFRADAARLAEKWLDTCASVFRKSGAFWEKYDVVRRQVATQGRYPTQSGFGWTNAVFIKMIEELGTTDGRAEMPPSRPPRKTK